MYKLNDKQRIYLLKLLGDASYIEKHRLVEIHMQVVVDNNEYTEQDRNVINKLIIPRYEKYKKTERVSEASFLNTKMLYINKLFQNFQATQGQKDVILKIFDALNTIQEVNEYYNNLYNWFTNRIK